MSISPDEPDRAELEARMRPGALSRTGFLGPDESLEVVLARDAETMARLGVSFEELANRLEALLDKALTNRRHRARIGPVRVEVEAYTGFQICPWALDPDAGQCTVAGPVSHASLDWTIRNTRTGQTLSGPGLITHLIRAHSFFEGIESPNRVDPEALIEVLEFYGD